MVLTALAACVPLQNLVTTAQPAQPAKAPATIAEPPTDPMLRLETGMHTVKIQRVSVDAAGRLLATASYDKTVRLWSLPEGRLLKVLRVPAGAGSEGKVYAVAVSPDGTRVAAGGWTGFEWDRKNSVYLFDAASGRLVRRLPGLPNVINHLAFSRDGRFLAAMLGGKNGVRVWRTGDWRQVLADTGYGDGSYGGDFDGDGRLVTTSRDGSIRLYDRNSQRIATVRAPGGKEPYGATFSPDGRRVAVGYVDTTRVDVLSGDDLGFLFSPDTADVSNGNLGRVAWSADSRFLFAGGKYVDGTGTNPIRRWADGGRGAPRDLAAALNTILGIRPLPDGGVVYGSGDAAFGVLDASGRKALERTSAIANFSGKIEPIFGISQDGSVVRFGFEYDGKRPALFSLNGRKLVLDPPADGTLSTPATSAPGLAVRGWENTREPKLNDRPLKLKQYERSRSLAIAPGSSALLLGTNWYLRLFDRDGRQNWQVPAPGTAWGVNVSGDGKVAVAAFGDGTIRWYHMSDGTELLALFPHNDGKRWVLWTPKGYFAASPGGAELIGWHVNRGKDQAADFFPAGRFRDVYERPDVVERVLATLDEDEALRLADAGRRKKKQEADLRRMLPPVVDIVSPGEGATMSENRVTVRYTVRAPSGEPVTGFKVLVDGREAGNARGVNVVGRADENCLTRAASSRGLQVKGRDGTTCAVDVTIPERNVEISLIAENRHAASEPATVRLKWQGTREFVIKPKLYALAIGVSRYQDPDLRLDYAAQDARDFAAVIGRQKGGGLYRDVTVKVLADGEASKGELLDGFDWLLRETTEKDVAMLFLAGHGVNDTDGTYYYLPVDGRKNKLRRTAVPYYEVRDVLSSLAGKAVFFVDTCHSGNVIGGTRRGDVDIDRVAGDLASAENGVVVFASSTGRQFSVERAEWRNGAFTEALVEGLAGRADFTGDSAVSLNELSLYLSERVKALTDGEQTPTSTKPKTVPDFPISVVR